MLSVVVEGNSCVVSAEVMGVGAVVVVEVYNDSVSALGGIGVSIAVEAVAAVVIVL